MARDEAILYANDQAASFLAATCYWERMAATFPEFFFSPLTLT